MSRDFRSPSPSTRLILIKGLVTLERIWRAMTIFLGFAKKLPHTPQNLLPGLITKDFEILYCQAYLLGVVLTVIIQIIYLYFIHVQATMS